MVCFKGIPKGHHPLKRVRIFCDISTGVDSKSLRVVGCLDWWFGDVFTPGLRPGSPELSRRTPPSWWPSCNQWRPCFFNSPCFLGRLPFKLTQPKKDALLAVRVQAPLGSGSRAGAPLPGPASKKPWLAALSSTCSSRTPWSPSSFAVFVMCRLRGAYPLGDAFVAGPLQSQPRDTPLLMG